MAGECERERCSVERPGHMGGTSTHAVTCGWRRARAAGSATHSATRSNAAGHHHASSPVRLPGGQRTCVDRHGSDYDDTHRNCQNSLLHSRGYDSVLHLAATVRLDGDGGTPLSSRKSPAAVTVQGGGALMLRPSYLHTRSRFRDGRARQCDVSGRRRTVTA